MYYGVVAPGIARVYSDYEEVKRIKLLYPYCKFRKFRTESDGWEFVRKFKNNHQFTQLRNYGDTFDKLKVHMEYIIVDNCVYYNFRTKDVGNIRLHSESAHIDNRNGLSMAVMPNIQLNPNMIISHLIAIYHGLNILGDYLDVDILVPNHSVFYALMSYTGNNRTIKRVLNGIEERMGNVSVTLLYEEMTEENE